MMQDIFFTPLEQEYSESRITVVNKVQIKTYHIE